MYRDFKELLSVLNAHRVKYLIVGGYAVSLHAVPRATKDLDILIGPSAENGKAVFAALAEFGAPLEGLTPKDFVEPGNFFRMGSPPMMVDILSHISGVDFDRAWDRRVEFPVDSKLNALFISREDLLAANLLPADRRTSQTSRHWANTWFQQSIGRLNQKPACRLPTWKQRESRPLPTGWHIVRGNRRRTTR